MRKAYFALFMLAAMTAAACSQKYTCPTYSKAKKSANTTEKKA
jgi:hypothetical protein